MTKKASVPEEASIPDEFWERWYEAECPERLRLITTLQLERLCVVWQLGEGDTHSLNSIVNSYLDDLARYMRRRYKSRRRQ